MKQVAVEGTSNELMCEEMRDVESDRRVPGELLDDRVGWIIEDPGVLSTRAVTPPRKARVDSVGPGWVSELDEARQPPRLCVQCKRASKCLLQIRLLACSKWHSAPREHPQPGF